MLSSRCRNHAAAVIGRDRHGALFFASTSTVPMRMPYSPSCHHHHYVNLQRPSQHQIFPLHRCQYHHYRHAANRRNLSSLRAHTTCNDDIEHQQQQQYAELPQKSGDRNGLLRHVVVADDGHPLRLYARAPRHHHRAPDDNVNGDSYDDGSFDRYNALLSTTMEYSNKNEKSNNLFDMHQQQQQQRSILLLHGRTWSSQPVFDLRTSDDDDKRQSTLQSLADLGFAAYALDLRGFGETPRDYRYDENDNNDNDGDQDDVVLASFDEKRKRSGGYTTPMRCVADVKCAIDWIANRHTYATSVADTNEDTTRSDTDDNSNMSINTKPALLGWSQGALVAQMYAQLHGPTTLSDLILFGSIYDPKTIYPRKPLYHNFDQSYAEQRRMMAAPENVNTEVAALEDFTLPGTICDEAASAFSTLALEVDPVKAAWDDLHEFNICNPALVHVPTLVMAGSQDPYVSWDAQRELFDRLGTEDKAMCILPGCDHAAHILKARRMFIRAVAGFLLRKDEF